MDYSICKALSFNMKDIPVALLMYDIMCSIGSISKKGLKKVRSSPYRNLWNSELELAYFIFTVIKTLACPDIRLALFPGQSKSMEK